MPTCFKSIKQKLTVNGAIHQCLTNEKHLLFAIKYTVCERVFFRLHLIFHPFASGQQLRLNHLCETTKKEPCQNVVKS